MSEHESGPGISPEVPSRNNTVGSNRFLTGRARNAVLGFACGSLALRDITIAHELLVTGDTSSAIGIGASAGVLAGISIAALRNSWNSY